MTNVLITGANSYIGDGVKEYLLNGHGEYSVDVKDTIGWSPKPEDFRPYDVVFNVAGIAHIKETKENQKLYYDVNRDLSIKIARAAKMGGVKQFILLSTMSVYGVVTGHITKNTVPNPVNAYGKSKAEADNEIKKIADENFRFACLRPPMVYGKGCKGNYQQLRSFARKSPIVPDYHNQRSMIYIGNLCEFVRICIEEEKSGLFFPQNSEYTNTSEMIRLIATSQGRKRRRTKILNLLIKYMPLTILKKAFGDLTYEKVDTVGKYGLEESIVLSER